MFALTTYSLIQKNTGQQEENFGTISMIRNDCKVVPDISSYLKMYPTTTLQEKYVLVIII